MPVLRRSRDARLAIPALFLWHCGAAAALKVEAPSVVWSPSHTSGPKGCLA